MVVAMARGIDELLAGDHAGALSIGDLYDEVEAAISRAFPRRRELWVRGEIQHVADQHGRSGHCYLDLVDPESVRDRQAPVLRVKCWQSTWGPLRAALTREGIELAPGMVVILRGTVDFYRPKAEIGFILQELDVTALLGRIAAQRAALLRTLAAEGLLERNRSLSVPAVPLRVGLVASPKTEGYRDFLGQLEGSGYSFVVVVIPVTVQGVDAPRSVAAAVTRLSAVGPAGIDIIVIVRGGGSKADLAAFDAEPVARAIAASTAPVWTGIGHTGDESVADIVANRSCITPTECGRELARRVEMWWEGVVAARADLVGRAATEVLTRSQQAHDAVRERLCAMARHLLDRQREHVWRRTAAVERCAPQHVEHEWASVVGRASRLAPLSVGHVERSADRLEAWRRLVAAYDVERQLERGYTITLDVGGRLVRSAASVSPGAKLLTRFADGTASSVVDAVAASDALAAPASVARRTEA
jgi:exodeoxyribonuclease VII large subunit